MRNQPSPQTDRWKRLSSFLPLDRFDPIAALLYLREHTTQREQIENVSVHRRADLQGFEPVNLAIFTALPGRRGIVHQARGSQAGAPAARHHDAQSRRPAAARADEAGRALSRPAGAHGVLDATGGSHRARPRPRRRRLHLETVPGARAAGARGGAHSRGSGARAGARRSAQPGGDGGHPPRSHGLAQTRRDLSHPRAPRGARAEHLEMLDGARQARRPARRRRRGVRKPDAA